MSESKITFGLIGCGAVAPYHALAMRKARGIELRCVADISPGHAESFSKRFDVEACDTVDQLLTRGDIDAVSIATPPSVTASLGVKAAREGKHVFVEKPMATTVDDALKLIRECESQNVKLSVWYERRYQPFAIRARQLVQDGAIGDVFLGLIFTLGYKQENYWTYGFRGEGPATNWRRSIKDSGGGVLNINACHQIDLMLHITGFSVREVYAQMRNVGGSSEVEDNALVTMSCNSDALIQVVASSKAYGLGRFPIYAARDTLVGTEGSIVLSSNLEVQTRLEEKLGAEYPLLNLADCKAAALEDFARSIRENIPCSIAPGEALDVLRVVRSAYDSADRNHPNSVGGPLDGSSSNLSDGFSV